MEFQTRDNYEVQEIKRKNINNPNNFLLQINYSRLETRKGIMLTFQNKTWKITQAIKGDFEFNLSGPLKGKLVFKASAIIGDKTQMIIAAPNGINDFLVKVAYNPKEHIWIIQKNNDFEKLETFKIKSFNFESLSKSGNNKTTATGVILTNCTHLEYNSNVTIIQNAKRPDIR